MGGNTGIWVVKANYVIRIHKRLRRENLHREHAISSTYRSTWWVETDYSQKTWTRRHDVRWHDVRWQLPMCGTKVLQLIAGEHWKGETTCRPKTAATKKQVSKTITTAKGQAQSTSARTSPSTTTDKSNRQESTYDRGTASTGKKQGSNYKRRTSTTHTTQDTKNKHYIQTNGCPEWWTGLVEKRSKMNQTPSTTTQDTFHSCRPEHPPTSTLEPYRTAHANIQTHEVSQIDEWTTTDMPRELQYTRKGTTTFTLNDVIAAPQHPDTLQGARARGRTQPTQATKQEMEERCYSWIWWGLTSSLQMRWLCREFTEPTWMATLHFCPSGRLQLWKQSRLGLSLLTNLESDSPTKQARFNQIPGWPT